MKTLKLVDDVLVYDMVLDSEIYDALIDALCKTENFS